MPVIAGRLCCAMRGTTIATKKHALPETLRKIFILRRPSYTNPDAPAAGSVVTLWWRRGNFNGDEDGSQTKKCHATCKKNRLADPTLLVAVVGQSGETRVLCQVKVRGQDIYTEPLNSDGEDIHSSWHKSGQFHFKKNGKLLAGPIKYSQISASTALDEKPWKADGVGYLVLNEYIYPIQTPNANGLKICVRLLGLTAAS